MVDLAPLAPEAAPVPAETIVAYLPPVVASEPPSLAPAGVF